MPDPTERQIAALALPGDDWGQAKARARRLLAAVVICEPCMNDGCDRWVEHIHPFAYCLMCSYRDMDNYDHRTGRERLE